VVTKLFKDIREFAAASSQCNHLSKHELWGDVTKAGKEQHRDIDGETLLRHMWAVAKEQISKWEGNEDEDSH